MRGINALILFPEGFQAGRGIAKLVDCEPFGGTGGTAAAPFLMPGDLGVQHINLLDTDGLAGAHNGRDIMGVKNVLENHGKVGLPAG